MPRFVFVVRFKERKDGTNCGLGNVKSFKTTASSPKQAAEHMRKKGHIISVRKTKRVH